MKILTVLMMSMFILVNFSQANEDLKLPGERWEAKSTGYLCGAFDQEIERPNSHEDFDVRFETLTTDRSLDNGLLKATFIDGDNICRYSALMLADNSASTIKLVESKAYSLGGNGDCLNGKGILDQQLAANEYLYWGHPHHVTIMFPEVNAASICGVGSTHIGLDFTVSRFLGQR